MFKYSTLFAVSTALVSTAASALTPNVYPAANLQANGASSIANILVQELNCYGGTNNPLGKTTPATSAVPDHTYTPTAPTTGNPVYNCGTQSIQPNIDGKYVSTGSGGGKTSWKNGNASGISNNPFGTWTNIHFAFSDSAINSADIASYNGAAKIKAGAPIQIPAYILPIAIGYSPVYGKLNVGGVVKTLSFNLNTAKNIGRAGGGLHISEATLCKVMTGAVTNFNDAAFTADNGGLSLKSPDDDATRWSTTGVPIKLVGRSDNSGTTNLFSRHLAAVCAGSAFATQGGGADQLPATTKGTAVYNKTTGALTSGTETPGLFGLADGSDGVAATLTVALADPANPGDSVLNGRLGYIGADWVVPATISGSTVFSADVQNGTDKKYYAPTAKNATLAASTKLPPQSLSTGKYDPAAVANGLRNDPLAWTQATNDLTGYAKPAKGYPIVGTTNMLLYTCYASSAVRNAVQGLLLEHFGKMPKDSTGASIPAKLASNTALDGSGLPLGIFPRNGVAPLSAQWSTAILETFVTKVTTGNNPSSLGLYIQDIQPKKTADTTTAKGNPSCAIAQGGDGTYAGI